MFGFHLSTHFFRPAGERSRLGVSDAPRRPEGAPWGAPRRPPGPEDGPLGPQDGCGQASGASSSSSVPSAPMS
eukprot:884188-Pyramimonas_sp.AAC.1